MSSPTSKKKEGSINETYSRKSKGEEGDSVKKRSEIGHSSKIGRGNHRI